MLYSNRIWGDAMKNKSIEKMKNLIDQRLQEYGADVNNQPYPLGGQSEHHFFSGNYRSTTVSNHTKLKPTSQISNATVLS